MTQIDDFLAAGRTDPPRSAPFTFVETGRKVLASPVENLDLSRPVEEALEGVLTVRWTAEAPILVGGGRAEEDPDAAEETFKPNDLPLSIDGRYALPGSTIKGLIRSVMEIASLARLS
ncbi:MAG TPA: hypothetical protein ENK83_07420, partial [Aliiroseovarius sp.]|nr:hypothetical protein [Aliiroseovarius sp.]